ncbi:LytR family transcriptional regulator [Nocardia colli]|uniref:LytR family transcriptional regulator n=1 Tax=Nocardia colli TaxID=2545717 RepID=A0A5N0EPU6_9NOCA|nr:LytR C-terminal domain-containing protein [Nocardia colli]KAA8890075.1 LytR family transcriptional regulator [Nocardia colli]
MSYPNPTSGGPPLRALAMVLIALAIVFGGLGAMSLSKSDADPSSSGPSESATSTTATAAPQVPASTTVAKTSDAAPSSSAAPPTTTTTTPPTTSAAAAKAVPVRVLNNSMIAGLAGKTANQLTADGWNVVETGNYPGVNIPKTTVYYGNSPGDKEAGQAIAQELGITAESKSSGLGESSPGVTVIVTGN